MTTYFLRIKEYAGIEIWTVVETEKQDTIRNDYFFKSLLFSSNIYFSDRLITIFIAYRFTF